MENRPPFITQHLDREGFGITQKTTKKTTKKNSSKTTKKKEEEKPDIIGERPIFVAKKTTKKTTKKTIHAQIVDLLRANPHLSRSDLSLILKKKKDAVQYHLNRLKKEGAIRRIGSDKGGYWEILTH